MEKEVELEYDKDFLPVYAAIEPIAKVAGWNGSSFTMLVLELKVIGKPVEDLTLNEFASIAERVANEYNRIMSPK